MDGLFEWLLAACQKKHLSSDVPYKIIRPSRKSILKVVERRLI